MKYCEHCGTELEDNADFCPACGVKCDTSSTTKKIETENGNNGSKHKMKKNKIVGGIAVVVAICLIIGIVGNGGIHQFLSDFKTGAEEAEKKAKENDSKNDENNGLKRVSKEYKYKLIGQDIPSCEEWFAESGELFGISNDTIYYLNKEEACLEEIGDIGVGECVPSTGKNDWIVFTDTKYVYKYNIQNKSTEIAMNLVEGGTSMFGSPIVVDNILYYYSEKEAYYWNESAQNSESYVPTFNGSYGSIWALNLSTNKDEKVIDGGVGPLVIDSSDNQHFYFTSEGSENNCIDKYDCETKETIRISEEFMTTNLIVNDGNCYIFNDDILLIQDGKGKCLKEELGSIAFWEDAVICSGNYVICDDNDTDSIVILDGDSIYTIQKQWADGRTWEGGKVLFAQEDRIWFATPAYDSTITLFSASLDGTIEEEKNWIELEEGEFVQYFNDTLYVIGAPKESWKINIPVDNTVVDEIEQKGYDVESYGQFENGKTELTMYVGDYGMYCIPLEEKEEKNVSKDNKETNNEEDISYQQKKSPSEQESAETDQESHKILEMFDNLIFYEGTWGDFGAHVNEYQGMVETAIKSSISLSDYFGDANGTYMILEKRVMNDDVLENGLSATNQLYTITFQGPSVTGTGGARTLECTVSSPDGVSLVYNEIDYY